MTISTTVNINQYAGDGVVITFPYTYPILNVSDMTVYLDGVLQTMGYTVIGAGNPTGSVQFDTAPAVGVEILLLRVIPLTQLTDYEEYDPFSATDHENALDKLTMIDQQLQEELDRTFKTPIGSDPLPDVVLGDNPEGKVLEVSADGSEINAVTSATDIFNAASSASAAAAAALASQNAAETSKNFANEWATNPEDNDVNDGVNPVNFSAFHYMKKAEELIATGVQTREGVVSGTGDIVTDFNAMDWTGHQYSGTPASAFFIPANSVTFFAHNDVTFVWYGPKDVNVGLGGDYTAVAADLVLRTFNIASVIGFDPNNTTLVSTNVQDAIDEVVNTTIPDATGAVNTGFKNVIINGDFRINQRGFDGVWDNPAMPQTSYGYDRWGKLSSGDNPPQFKQSIEDENLIDGETYTLSWEGGGNAVIKDGNASLVAIGPSPLKGTITFGSNRCSVEMAGGQYNVQFERGTIATNFEVRNIQQELAMCQRYYEVGHDVMPYQDTTDGNTYSAPCSFKMTKRVIPIITLTHTHSNRFPTNSGSTLRVTEDDFYETRVCNLTGPQGFFRSEYVADAEIT